MFVSFINFIFSSFWIFLGFIIILTILIGFIGELFDFIVELIHGKPINQNIYNSYEKPKDLSLDRKEDGEEEGNGK